ncbi:hypothetical protein EDD11_005571 [Mortierella claussenii]|nr:hypothetical protein EDD11_005571 [Mortierella claussenii]
MLQDILLTCIVVQGTGVMNDLKSLHDFPSLINAQTLESCHRANQLQYDHKVNGGVSTAEVSRVMEILKQPKLSVNGNLIQQALFSL